MTHSTCTPQRSPELQAILAKIDAAAAEHGFSGDDDKFYATREDGTRYKLSRAPAYIAPNCQGSVLAYPPIIVRDTSEQPFLMLTNGDDAGPERETIIKVARLTARNQYGRYDVVLVLTDEAIYTMQGKDFDNQKWIGEIKLAPAEEPDTDEPAPVTATNSDEPEEIRNLDGPGLIRLIQQRAYAQGRQDA